VQTQLTRRAATALFAVAMAAGVAGIPVASAQEPVTVTYWSMFTEGEPLQVVLAGAIDAFEAENPGIKVEVNWAGREVLSALQGAMAGNESVDIVDQSNTTLSNALLTTGLALDLDTYLDGPGYDGTGVWRDSFHAGAFDQAKGADGGTYLIPRDDYIRAFFTNTAALAKAGVTAKTSGMTWDEFTTMLAALKAAGVNPIGVDGTETGYNEWWFIDLAVRYVGVDAFLAAAQDKTGAAWADPAYLEAAKQLRDLRDKEYFNKGYEGSVWPSAQVGWVNGANATMLMGAWLPAEMSDQTPEGFTNGMFSFPNVTGGKGNDIVEHWFNGYAVLKDSAHPAEAARLLQYLSSPTVGNQIVALGTAVPFNGVPDPAALAGQAEILASSTQMPSNAGLGLLVPEWESTVFSRCNDPFFQGSTTPEAFIACLMTESATYWSTH
jgi:raffinose/stachyose/melibiose transport system substrate-binding protein